MSRKLDDLSDRMRPLVFELLARLTEEQIPVMIVDTLRTEAEHDANLKRGASQINISNHLDGATFRSTIKGSDAIDLCPFGVFMLQGPDKLAWDAKPATWLRIGEIGESVGLKWGGRWKSLKDYGHFEHADAREGLTGDVPGTIPA